MTRVGPLGEVGGVRMRLDHGVVGVPLDLVLELCDHMAGRDDEAPRVETHGLVLRATKRDEPIAAELPALAPERDDSIAPFGVDALVEHAERRLVPCHAPRVRVTAGCVGEEVHPRSHHLPSLAAAPDGTTLVFIN